MVPQKLDLHIAQVARAFDNSKKNDYSDSRKSNFHLQLKETFDITIASIGPSVLNLRNILSLRNLLNFILHNLEYLDTSIKGKYPTEITKCLDTALEDWLDDFDRYIILTSISHRNNSYKFENYNLGTYRSLEREISAQKGLTFSFGCEPIMLLIPRFQSHCFLSNAVLYHEMGHFIDFRYKIIDTLFDDDPFLSVLPDKEKTKNHYREFFADVFAAQYVGNASNEYLNYIGYKNNVVNSHPATDDRLKVVDDFLAGRSNKYLDKILPSTEILTKREIKIRFESLDENSFQESKSIKLENKQKLSSLFPMAWKVWIDAGGKFRVKHNDALLTAHNEMNQMMIDSINSIK